MRENVLEDNLANWIALKPVEWLCCFAKMSVEKVSIHTGYLSKSNETFIFQMYGVLQGISKTLFPLQRKRNFLLDFFLLSIFVNIRKENEMKIKATEE